MTTLTAILLMTVTLTMTVSVVCTIYGTLVKVEDLYLAQETELLQELLCQRNAWVVRHLGCGLGALTLVWIAKTIPGMEVPSQLAQATGIYAASSLLFSLLESLLAQKISHLLAGSPVQAGRQDQR